jgi:hypothetical protein
MNRFDLKEKREALWRDLAASANQPDFDVAVFSELLEEMYLIDRFWTYPGRGVLVTGTADGRTGLKRFFLKTSDWGTFNYLPVLLVR